MTQFLEKKGPDTIDDPKIIKVPKLIFGGNPPYNRALAYSHIAPAERHTVRQTQVTWPVRYDRGT